MTENETQDASSSGAQSRKRALSQSNESATSIKQKKALPADSATDLGLAQVLNAATAANTEALPIILAPNSSDEDDPMEGISCVEEAVIAGCTNPSSQSSGSGTTSSDSDPMQFPSVS